MTYISCSECRKRTRDVHPSNPRRKENLQKPFECQTCKRQSRRTQEGWTMLLLSVGILLGMFVTIAIMHTIHKYG